MPSILQRISAHVLHDARLEGYRIAIMGDFHLAPWRSRRALQRAVDLVADADPDLVALVGDYGYSLERFPPISRSLYRRVLPRVVAELARLRSRDGTYAVLGNHDVDAGAELVAEALATCGVHVLRNSFRDIPRSGTTLRVFGVDDLTRARREGSSVSLPISGESAATLVLSHHPDIVLSAARPAAMPAIIVVAGHTHGGQIAFPFVGAPITLSRAATRRFPSGFVPNDFATLYVTRGVGEQIPLRVRAPREVTLLELAVR